MKPFPSIFHLLLFWILFLSATPSQGKPETSPYYRKINKAELAICQGRYARAGRLYEQAFQKHRPFWTDLYRATLLNHHLLKNYERASHHATTLTALGNFSYTWLVKDTLAERELYLTYKAIQQDTPKLLDSVLRAALDSIIKDDQKVRQGFGSFDENDWIKVRYMDSVNLVKVKGLYKQYGFLDQYNAGSGIDSDIWLLFTHFNKGYGEDPFSLLWEQVLTGRLDAREYAQLIDNRLSLSHLPDRYAAGHNYFFLWEGTFFIIDPPDPRRIHKNRKEIGIHETWKDLKTKLVYSFSRKDSPVKFIATVQEVHGSPIKDCQNAQEMIRKIDEGDIKGSYFDKNLFFKSK